MFKNSSKKINYQQIKGHGNYPLYKYFLCVMGVSHVKLKAHSNEKSYRVRLEILVQKVGTKVYVNTYAQRL